MMLTIQKNIIDSLKITNKVKHERLKRKDYKYDLLIPINYNTKKPIL